MELAAAEDLEAAYASVWAGKSQVPDRTAPGVKTLIDGWVGGKENAPIDVNDSQQAGKHLSMQAEEAFI